ncbi:MAG: hypothetical protein AAFY63_11060 [Cyanobacteria bacterium J06643_13]
MSNPKQFCIEPGVDASRTFGQNIAINDKYLVITDSLRNKVTVYTPGNSGEWERAKEILPPADLDLSNVSSAFGTGLELDGDVLAISAITKNLEWREASLYKRDGIFQYIYWRYLTNLETGTPLEPIESLVEPEPESDLVRFNLLRQGKIEQFILPKMGKKAFGGNQKGTLALDGNLLLVGYLSEDSTGGAYLFDLARPKAEPLKLAVEDTALGGTIAVSQQFAAVGFDGFFSQFSQGNARDRSHMTLIRNLENGASTVIKRFGKVSLSGNILAVMHIYDYEAPTVSLEVYRLDENAQAHLIDKREVYRGEVQNGFLFTQTIDDYRRVCIEPLSIN